MSFESGIEAAFAALRAFEFAERVHQEADSDPLLAAEIRNRYAEIADLRRQIQAHARRIGTARECPADMTAVQLLAHEAKSKMQFFAMTRDEQLACLHRASAAGRARRADGSANQMIPPGAAVA